MTVSWKISGDGDVSENTRYVLKISRVDAWANNRETLYVLMMNPASIDGFDRTIGDLMFKIRRINKSITDVVVFNAIADVNNSVEKNDVKFWTKASLNKEKNEKSICDELQNNSELLLATGGDLGKLNVVMREAYFHILYNIRKKVDNVYVFGLGNDSFEKSLTNKYYGNHPLRLDRKSKLISGW